MLKMWHCGQTFVHHHLCFNRRLPHKCGLAGSLLVVLNLFRFQKTTTLLHPLNVKPIWILLKQETVSGSGISRAICKSAPRSRQPRQHPTTQFLQAGCPSYCPTNSVKALKSGINDAGFLPVTQPTVSKHKTMLRALIPHHRKSPTKLHFLDGKTIQTPHSKVITHATSTKTFMQ